MSSQCNSWCISRDSPTCYVTKAWTSVTAESASSECRMQLSQRKENKQNSVLDNYLGHLLVWCSLHIPATCTVMFVTFSLIIFQLFLGVNLSSGASRGAAWCWAEAQVKCCHHRCLPYTMGRSLLPIAVGKLLLFTVYQLFSAIIRDHLNKRSSINQYSFNIPSY